MPSDRLILSEIELIEDELKRRKKTTDPTTYGLPDLLRHRGEYETVGDFVERQNRELVDFVCNRMYLIKDTKKIEIKMIPEMERFLCDMFYKRYKAAILWKPRGGGGSAITSALLFLSLVYHRMSFLNFAGSELQSKIIFDYVIGYFSCFPDLSRALIERQPTTDTLVLKGGVVFKSSTASEKSARGQHKAGLMVDEACLLPGTWIITKDGMKKIEDVIEGDYVWTHKGRFRKVLATKITQRENYPCVTLKPLGGLPYSTTQEHLCLNEKAVWVKAEDWKPKDLTYFSRSQEKTYVNRPDWLTTKEGWEWLGMHLGDGQLRFRRRHPFIAARHAHPPEGRAILRSDLELQRVFLGPASQLDHNRHLQSAEHRPP